MFAMKQFLPLLLFISYLPGYGLVEVKQAEGLLIVESGNPAVLTCEQDDSSYYNMYWYQHKPGQGLKLMIFSLNAGAEEMEGDFKARWVAKRPSVLSSSLHLNKSAMGDSATYFCASSISSNQRQYFGHGTILSVLEGNKTERHPKVKIFPPNKREFQEHNLISLVCIASDFFPEHVRLTWYVNNIKREGLYQNVPRQNPDNETFSTSKRLSLTKSEYFNPEATFRCEAGFIGQETVSYEIHGETDCGVSKESFSMYVNQGKISYFMVLFKSGLYALIVLAIIWRRKVLAGSC